MKLSGKVAVVTGGSQGIGEAVVRALAGEGASVAVIASSSVDKAATVAASLGSANAKARGYAADVRDAQAMLALAQQVVADFGRIDIFELAPFGININAIGPGNTATPLNEYIRHDPAYKSVLDEIVASTPSGQAYSSPEDIAQIALFLVSDVARAMHGSFVLADEGYSAGADFTAE
jgi:NAD(P)-dependent dehydrogenase (short-subunit alcohol dehydrogenase family)